MVNLKLFVDPHEVEYPTLVREVLADAHRKTGISATVTPFGKCALICGNSVYVWSYSSKDSGIPHATRMNLPASGLKYSTQLICIFSKGLSHKHCTCLLAVSPEGNVRYWPELGKPCRDESCLLNNEVAHSIQLVDSQDHVHRFLLTTTTGSFHMIDIFRSSAGQAERMATRPLDLGVPGGGIGKRMSLFLFGNSASEREQIQKTLIVRGNFGLADLVNVLPRYLRFYAIFERKALLHEVDIADMALSKYNKGRDNAERRHFLVLDATTFRSGILLLFVGVLIKEGVNDDKQIFIGYYEEGTHHEQVASLPRSLKTLFPIEIPESLSATGLDKRLSRCSLLVPSAEECAIVFSDAFLLVRHPIKPTGASTFCLDSFGETGEQLLGASSVNGLSHVMLKEKGLCTVRRLPELFDLSFWKKYRSILLQMEEQPNVFVGEEHRLKDAFIEFCAKDIKKTKSLLRDLDQRMVENESAEDGGARQSAATSSPHKTESSIAEMSVDLALFLLDRQPSLKEDPRWSYAANAQISNEQKGKLRELSSGRKFTLILRLLGDKHAHYKMAVLFLRTLTLSKGLSCPNEFLHLNKAKLKLSQKTSHRPNVTGHGMNMRSHICFNPIFSASINLDQPLEAFQNRNGKAVIAELGEKLAAAILCFQWLAENGDSLPLVNSAVNELAKQYATRFGFPKGNPFLSAVDLVFCKVSSFHELVSAVVQLSEQAMEGRVDKTKVIIEVGDLLVTIVQGIKEMRREEWALQVEDDHSTWLNQPDFLTHFTTHLNTALDFLQSTANRTTTDNQAEEAVLNPSQQQNSVIFKQCIQLADFVLSQQSPTQRNDSKIISRFVSLGKMEVALGLAEKYKDFTMLVVYCHNQLDKQQCAKTLERYKEQYEKDGFHNFLYTWYQQKGMYNHLLAERGKRISDFLSHRQEINWIRQIDEGQFGKAKCTLRRMSEEEVDKRKKLIASSLAKMAALCDNEQNLDEIAELSEQIRALHECSNEKFRRCAKMGKRKTPFIDRKSAVSFRLLHRSQKDPLIADESLGERVLHPMSNPTELEERRKFGIYYRDDYDYLQHLKEVGETVEIVGGEPVEEQEVIKAENPANALNSCIFETRGVELKVGMLNQAASSNELLPDIDPDIVAALDGDMEASDANCELDDDFVAKANAPGDRDGMNLFDFFDESRGRAEVLQRFGLSSAREKFSDESSTDGEGDDDDEEETDSTASSDVGEHKTTFTNYSISSSVIKRPDGLRLIDDHFETLYAEQYAEGNEEENGEEKREGPIGADSEHLLSLLGEEQPERICARFQRELPDAEVKASVLRYAKAMKGPAGEGRSEQTEDILMDSAKRSRWDCESILSTHSNLYNHPTAIREQSKRSQRGEAPAGKKGKSELEEMDVDGSDSCGAIESVRTRTSMASSVRSKGETPEARRLRKRAVREERRERRKDKKLNREAFREEKLKLEAQRKTMQPRTRPIH
uniref:Protein LTV1 homolog n=1 Tax=Globodera rostochiensis TaxID=31243 RepID=A0A914HDL4_GLORO